MKRSAVLGSAFLAVLGRVPAGAQQSGKVYRVGVLEPTALSSGRANFDAFLRALAGLGYQEGKNLEIVYRSTAGDQTRLPALARELVRAKPDVVVAAATGRSRR